MTTIDEAAVARAFEMPAVAAPFKDVFYTPAEQRFAVERGAGAQFDGADVPQAAAMHHRGVVDALEDRLGFYRVGTFYNRLDVFAVSEREAWAGLPEDVRCKLDDWYLGEYVAWARDAEGVAPSRDTVLTLEETLAFIDAQSRPAYLNVCDCRSLAEACDAPREVCITYKDWPNSFCGRGLSRAITKDEAKDVVRTADAAGLMHTVNPNGICSCCGDCCYLMRGMKALKTQGVWPVQPHIVHFDASECIGCGRCVKRCNLDVFERVPGVLGKGRGRLKVTADVAKCVGCGLCVGTCPTGALRLESRSLPVEIAAESVLSDASAAEKPLSEKE